MKHGIFNCFIEYDTHIKDENGKYTTKINEFHFSGRAEEEKQIRNCACVCDMLLQQLGIKHRIKYTYRPMSVIYGEEINNE